MGSDTALKMISSVIVIKRYVTLTKGRNLITVFTVRIQGQTDKQMGHIEPCIQTCVGLAFLHIALPECVWFGNRLTEAVWHHGQILLTHAVDSTMLLTPTTTHRALQIHTQTRSVPLSPLVPAWFIVIANNILKCPQCLKVLWLPCD